MHPIEGINPIYLTLALSASVTLGMWAVDKMARRLNKPANETKQEVKEVQ